MPPGLRPCLLGGIITKTSGGVASQRRKCRFRWLKAQERNERSKSMVSKRLLNSTASIVLLIVTGVVLTRATIPDAKGAIHGCYTKSGGTIRVIDDSITSCNADET